MPRERRYLTTAELSRALAVSASAIQEWRRKGWITPAFVTPGGQARWVEADVREQVRKINEERRQAEDGPDG